MNKALVIGYGSIGKRHADILKSMNVDTAVVSRREIEFKPAYSDIETALKEFEPEYVVVASRTSEHCGDLERLAEFGFKGVVLVEKPLFDHKADVPMNNFKAIYAAYNLRFTPAIQALKKALQDKQMISMQVYAGQYLPNWRQGTDYRQSYSAKRTNGGGVLRDLSHELDYSNWLTGGWRRLVARGGHFSNLEIESDDTYMVMFESVNCPLVTVHVNYLDRKLRREILVQTTTESIKVDLVACTIEINGEIQELPKYDRDLTYRAEHEEAMETNPVNLCQLDEALDIVRMIEACESSSERSEWVMS